MTRTGYRLLIGMLAAALLLIISSGPGFAQGSGGGAGTDFQCSAGKSSGELYTIAASCPKKLSADHFFSFLICNMEKLTGNVMGALYCGLLKALTPLVWSAAALAITLFGASFMAGITQLSRGAAVLFVIKIAFVTGMALNADLLIGVAYRLLITIVHQGSEIAVSAISPNINSLPDFYAVVDDLGAKLFGMATDMLSGTLSKDPSITDARCKNAFFAVLAVMFLIAPVIGYLGLALIGRLLMAIFSAVFGYIYAIIGITFLMILAPFFLCFYLFKQTQPFFDKWVGYLASFTLQAVLLFAALGFVLTIKDGISDLTKTMPDIIMFNSKAADTGSLRFPWQYCTVCKFEAVDKDGNVLKQEDFSKAEKLRCTDPKQPIDPSFAIAPDPTAPDATQKSQMGTLIYVGGGMLITLLVLAWMVEHLLKLIPSLAQQLGRGMGASAAPQLGGGDLAYGHAANMPGYGLISDFRDGFRYGYGASISRDKMGANTLSATASGLKEGLSTMVTGYTTGQEKGKQQSFRPGIGGRMMDWLTDPAKLD